MTKKYLITIRGGEDRVIETDFDMNRFNFNSSGLICGEMNYKDNGVVCPFFSIVHCGSIITSITEIIDDCEVDLDDNDEADSNDNCESGYVVIDDIHEEIFKFGTREDAERYCKDLVIRGIDFKELIIAKVVEASCEETTTVEVIIPE